MEAAATAGLLHDLQKKMADERASFGANVEATLKKVATATNLGSAQKATADLSSKGPAQNQMVPLPMGLAGPGPGGTACSSPSSSGSICTSTSRTSGWAARTRR